MNNVNINPEINVDHLCILYLADHQMKENLPSYSEQISHIVTCYYHLQ